MNKDQTQGRIEEAKGKVKEVVGKVVGNEELEQEGKIQKIGGKVQAQLGDLKDDIKKVIKG
ncbi:MAG: CsbD family protein, partial [Pseudomonas sagittaria]|nr:CsbD family protein [Pseudomonas sagittaria]